MIMLPFIILEAFWYYYGNIERFLAGWKYCNLYYSYTIDFFNLYIFGPFLHQRLWQGSDHVLRSYGSSIFFIFWCKMERKLTWISAQYFLRSSYIYMHLYFYSYIYTFIYSLSWNTYFMKCSERNIPQCILVLNRAYL